MSCVCVSEFGEKYDTSFTFSISFLIDARFQNLKFFVAARAIEETHWERSEYVESVWYTQDGNKFPFGEYIDLSLNTDVIGYDEDDVPVWRQFFETSKKYTGNKLGSKHIAIFLSEAHQFDILLNGRNGTKAVIKWIKHLEGRKSHVVYM